MLPTWVERTELEYTVAPSNKFYHVVILTDGQQWTVQRDWGRIGTNGQSESTVYALEKTARAAASSIIQEKLGKGYKVKSTLVNSNNNLAERVLTALLNITKACEGHLGGVSPQLALSYQHSVVLLKELGLYK